MDIWRHESVRNFGIFFVAVRPIVAEYVKGVVHHLNDGEAHGVGVFGLIHISQRRAFRNHFSDAIELFIPPEEVLACNMEQEMNEKNDTIFFVRTQYIFCTDFSIHE
jgi:hypothetical protein